MRTTLITIGICTMLAGCLLTRDQKRSPIYGHAVGAEKQGDDDADDNDTFDSPSLRVDGSAGRLPQEPDTVFSNADELSERGVPEDCQGL